ncbi:phosphate ABC transporter ATP-binding protein [Stenotrophomonas lactitubi]|uniref:Phosphate ABC transporter ATP-binding protein n=1 Tax=Stenotrophomonas lactitubi TaxID=2045214 RepID=A0AAW4GCV8_9GAMM|nr:phosphate ABC transporter ATP-binding protein [Stenotrophomonas lactitubi]MBM9920698.1 phosphate ABC transporter ATP-binding protein [Stenotrophomonas lactitubi]MBM9937860.1 phosphate ABC transporter ATP-binding protein [Stenotrophomonas lactitubi]
MAERTAVAGYPSTVRAEVRALDFHYDKFHALKNINLSIGSNQVTALIGPSGCGKSTLLRCFNRMHDLYPNNRYSGSITLLPEDLNIVGPDVDPMRVRLRIGMVFQKPNPFPKSIFDNVASGIVIRGVRNRSVVSEHVERALRGAALWDEVKDRLDKSAFELSGGQQQRLCIARALAPNPEIILFDEPTSALDPIATARIEELIDELRSHYTIVIVTHNMQQAARISDQTAFMHMGSLIESGPTAEFFTNPKELKTHEYITGRFG